jgi:hypothetical protein
MCIPTTSTIRASRVGDRSSVSRAFAHVVETARYAYAELSVSVVDLIEGADRAAARIVWDGVRSSGERARRETIDIVRVVEGRAIEHWGGQT